MKKRVPSHRVSPLPFEAAIVSLLTFCLWGSSTARAATFDQICQKGADGLPLDPNIVNCWGFESESEIYYHDKGQDHFRLDFLLYENGKYQHSPPRPQGSMWIDDIVVSHTRIGPIDIGPPDLLSPPAPVMLSVRDPGSVGDPSEPVGSFWHPNAGFFRFTGGTGRKLNFSHMIDNPDQVALTFSLVGAWPDSVTLDGDNKTLAYDGSPTDPIGDLRIRAAAEGKLEESPPIQLTFVGASAIPTATYGMVVESDEGTDSTIAWQTAFLLNDGRIASFGTGNHNTDQTNAIRIIDPVANVGEVSTYDLFPWTQDISPPSVENGNNLYVHNYDNDPSIYLPPDDTIAWLGHGIFDVGVEQWLYGSRPPFTAAQTWREYIGGAVENFHPYNPAVGYCDEIDTGVFFGASDGGYGQRPTDLVRILRNDGDVRPQWRVETTNMAGQGVEALRLARNSAACVGSTFYVGGPAADHSGNRFYAIDIAEQKLIATLTPFPEGERFPQIVYDSRRDRLVLIGKRLRTYSFAEDVWTDVTPDGWGIYSQVNGIYHPTLDAIFFRGTTADFNCCWGSEYRTPSWSWNRLVFHD